jgi:hypothetical protein
MLTVSLVFISQQCCFNTANNYFCSTCCQFWWTVHSIMLYKAICWRHLRQSETAMSHPHMFKKKLYNYLLVISVDYLHLGLLCIDNNNTGPVRSGHNSSLPTYPRPRNNNNIKSTWIQSLPLFPTACLLQTFLGFRWNIPREACSISHQMHVKSLTTVNSL